MPHATHIFKILGLMRPKHSLRKELDRVGVVVTPAFRPLAEAGKLSISLLLFREVGGATPTP